MAYPSQGERVNRAFRIPVELADWLEKTSRPHGLDRVCPAGMTQNDLVVKAVYLLRELHDGIPSPTSQELLEKALRDLDPNQGNHAVTP